MKEWELESILFSNLWFLCTLTHSKYTYWLVNISFKIEGENKHICRETKPKKVHFQQTCTTKIYFCRLEVKHNRLNIHSTGMEEEHYKWGLVPDGGVEGCALTPYCENTRITTNCWTIINRKTLEHTKKDTLHPKTKEKPQWDGRRGAITIKSNPILVGGWLTDWRTLIPQKSTHWSEGSEPHVRLPNLGVWQWEEEFLEKQTSKASGIWLQDFDRTGGNRDSTLGGHTQSSVCIRTQGKKQWRHRRLNQTYLLVLEGLLQRQGGCVSLWGQGHWQQKFWEVLLGMSPPRVHH